MRTRVNLVKLLILTLYPNKSSQIDWFWEIGVKRNEATAALFLMNTLIMNTTTENIAIQKIFKKNNYTPKSNFRNEMNIHNFLLG